MQRSAVAAAFFDDLPEESPSLGQTVHSGVSVRGDVGRIMFVLLVFVALLGSVAGPDPCCLRVSPYHIQALAQRMSQRFQALEFRAQDMRNVFMAFQAVHGNVSSRVRHLELEHLQLYAIVQRMNSRLQVLEDKNRIEEMRQQILYHMPWNNSRKKKRLVHGKDADMHGKNSPEEVLPAPRLEENQGLAALSDDVTYAKCKSLLFGGPSGVNWKFHKSPPETSSNEDENVMNALRMSFRIPPIVDTAPKSDFNDTQDVPQNGSDIYLDNPMERLPSRDGDKRNDISSSLIPVRDNSPTDEITTSSEELVTEAKPAADTHEQSTEAYETTPSVPNASEHPNDTAKGKCLAGGVCASNDSQEAVPSEDTVVDAPFAMPADADLSDSELQGALRDLDILLSTEHRDAGETQDQEKVLLKKALALALDVLERTSEACLKFVNVTTDAFKELNDLTSEF